MVTLKDAGFKGTMVAVGNGAKLALGTLASGEVVIVASTPNGEGYTAYDSTHDAIEAFNAIVSRAGLVRV